MRRSGWLAGLLALCSGAAAAAPCSGFVDVQDADPFCASVAWMKNRGITLGCTATQYCPSDAVTRLQMAAFMYRLGVQNAFLNGGNAFGATAVLGTTDDRALDLRVNGTRALRLEPNAISHNVVAGAANGVLPGVRGASIGGGGAFPNTDPDLSGEGGNFAYDNYATIAGGVANVAGLADANVDGAKGATVGGGTHNSATASYATVVGGGANTASASGATVLGGGSNVAAGQYSVAMGWQAQALDHGCFVFSDRSSLNPTLCGVPNAFVARAVGGYYLITAGTVNGSYSGAHLAPGATAWTTFSDRSSKANVVAVDAGAILDKVARLPIATWNWRSQDASIRHIGPMAQDFHAAFGLGETPQGISTVDADGVALAAIQGLNAKLEAALAQRDAQIAALRAQIDALRRERR